MLCPRCRAVLPGGLTYCIYCGQPLAPAYPPPSSHAAVIRRTSILRPARRLMPLHMAIPTGSRFIPPAAACISPMLVWSSVNVFLFTILGAIALALTISAKGDWAAEEEQKKLRIAMVLNIIGTVLSAAYLMILFMPLFFR